MPASGGAPTTLPHSLTPLIGREREVAAAARLMRDGQRLLTLTGPSGVGKTRLSVAIAGNTADLFPDGSVFVSLAPILDPDLVPRVVAAAFELPDPEPSQIVAALSAHIGNKRVLLVLDNFEHLLDAVTVIPALLLACPGLCVLVTSRGPLQLIGEHLLPVPTLDLPTSTRTEDAARSAALQLFTARARAACGEFDLTADNTACVLEICQKLDGLPLAIELAAARLRMLPPVALLERLEHGLAVLSGGARDAHPRLRAMRDAIAWSYALLAPPHQALFRRLGIFAGGWSLDAVEPVCLVDGPELDPLDGLSSLLDQSLIQRATIDAAEPRFEMLHVVREFALAELAAAGEEHIVRRAYAGYFHQVAERAGAARGLEQERRYERVTLELNNLRAILAWATSDARQPVDLDEALELAGVLWFYWIHHSRGPGEARLWLTRALQLQPTNRSGPRGKGLLGLGAIEWRQGDYTLARQHLEESAEILDQVDDVTGLSDALHLAGHVRFEARDYAAAHALFERSQAAHARADDPLGGLALIGDLGMVAYHQHDYATAREWFEHCLRACREHGVNDHAADSLNRLGDLARIDHDLPRAEALYTESLGLWRSVHGTPGTASALHKLGQTARRRGDASTAMRLVLESLALQREIGNKQGLVECLAALAGLAFEWSTAERAVELLGAASAALDELGAPLAPADAADFARDLARGKASLPSAAWAAAELRGRILGLGPALELAQPAAVLPGPVDGAATPSTSNGVLSPRESEVVALIARGLSNREIAAALTISEKTAANHVEHILTKLDLRSRAQIAIWALGQQST
jgi:predicted ATPase/DNA-binding CsgD family transcriptional regulator